MKNVSTLCAALAVTATPLMAENIVPTDMAPTCVVSPADFKSWFAGKSVAENAAVSAPDSVTFTADHNNNPDKCDFYQWGAQMFLWLTSAEGDKHVMDGQGFFTVSPKDQAGNRTLIPNSITTPSALQLRSMKTDTPTPDDIGEIGQAGGSGVLMSQANSLVYYGLMANDAYAYFLTGQKAPSSSLSSKTMFPRNAADLADLETYLKSDWSDVTLHTGNQLAMELKTAWVKSSTLENPQDYITISGSIPNFVANATNTKMTVAASPAANTVELALVGMHVVGTVQDHPEFVWATFEHVNNAPDAPYYYLADDGTTALHGYNTTSDFLFMDKGGAATNANVECMSENKAGAIVVKTTAKGQPVCAGGIVPSNTVREYPWGSLANDASSGTISNNTLLLSINNSVRSQLAAGDARANYIQTGSVWTTTPSAGATAPIPNQGSNQSLNLRGSTNITNMTMETYTQGTNCFSCHSLPQDAGNSFGPFGPKLENPGLSHIYYKIKGLVPAK